MTAAAESFSIKGTYPCPVIGAASGTVTTAPHPAAGLHEIELLLRNHAIFERGFEGSSACVLLQSEEILSAPTLGFGNIK